MPRYVCYIVFILVSLLLSRPAEAVSSKDRDRVILTYTTASDRCIGITSATHPSTKEAADAACDAAFKALDDLGKNSCHGWRKPECRHLRGYKHSQCSCTISGCNRIGIKNDDTKSFRECASEVWTDEFFDGEAEPSERFQELWRASHESLKVSRALPAFFDFKGSSGSEVTILGSRRLSPVDQQSDTAILGTQSTVGAGAKAQFYCQPCGMPFNKIGNFKKHLDRLHPGESPNAGKSDFYCHLCKQYYSSKGNLVKHFKKVHPGKEPVLPVQVEEIIQEPGEFHCYSCKRDFSTKGNLIKHARNQHPETEQGAPKKPTKESKKYRCCACGDAFDRARHLMEHEFFHLEDSVCYLCNINLGTRQNLERHFNQNHRGTISGSKESPGPSVGSKRKHT